MRWLRLRPENLPMIHGIAAYQAGPMNVTRTWRLRVPADTQRIIVDSPPGLKGQALAEQVKNINIILVPVLPSSIDMYATADFIRDLMLVGRIRLSHTRIGIVANRIRANTRSFQSLERFLHRLNIPVVAKLRDTQNYVHAVERGVSINELTSPRARADKLAMMEIPRWIESCQTSNLTIVEPTRAGIMGPGATRKAR